MGEPTELYILSLKELSDLVSLLLRDGVGDDAPRGGGGLGYDFPGEGVESFFRRWMPKIFIIKILKL